MTKETATRLTKQDWISAGLNSLIEDGPPALRAEPLARRLKTTKGSFYWHFRDVAAYHAALLDSWQVSVVNTLEQAATTGSTPPARLRLIMQSLITEHAEPALRAWAKSDLTAQNVVSHVDMLREKWVQQQLSEIGVNNPEMTQIIYATALGLSDLAEGSIEDRQSAMGSLIDLVLALR